MTKPLQPPRVMHRPKIRPDALPISANKNVYGSRFTVALDKNKSSKDKSRANCLNYDSLQNSKERKVHPLSTSLIMDLEEGPDTRKHADRGTMERWFSSASYHSDEEVRQLSHTQ